MAAGGPGDRGGYNAQMADTAPDFPSLASQLLLAMPGIGDPRFAQAVIALCMHEAEGALGVGIGRIVPSIGLHALLGQLDIDVGVAPDAPIHLGGPCEPQRGFVLHSGEWRGQDTMVVNDTLCLTTTLDVLQAIAAGTGPDRWLVALGYAGWGEGQLDGEMLRHGWFHLPATDELLFETPTRERWSRAFASAGIDVRLLASSAGRA